MARTDTLTNFLTDVASAIKAKKGDNTSIPAANFDTEIANLTSGGGDNSAFISLINRTVTNIKIPDGTTSIGSSAFRECTSLTSITIPESVTSIGNWAFSACTGLTSIIIPDSVTNIGTYIFYNCRKLTSIMIPNSLTSISGSMLRGCTSLTSITIPDSVTKIEYSAFEDCTSLISITIPDRVTSIGNNAFYRCTKLTEIDFSTHNVVPTLAHTNAFDNTPANLVIKVPSDLVDKWKAATNWSTLANKIVGV